jgi:ankyrin repeat protein
MVQSRKRQASMSHLMFQLRSVRAGVTQLLDDIGNAMNIEATPVTVDARDASNDTPLHYAAYWGDVRAIEMLVNAGAALDAHGAFDATPLLLSIFNGHYAAAQRLVELGASPRESTALGTAAQAAAQSHDLRIRTLFAEAAQASA